MLALRRDFREYPLIVTYFQEYPGPSQRVKKTLKVEKQSVSLKENGIQLNLTVIDTPGFGDSVSIQTSSVETVHETLN